MASTGGITSYSPISLLTGTALLAPKTTAISQPTQGGGYVTTAVKPATTTMVVRPVTTMSQPTQGGGFTNSSMMSGSPATSGSSGSGVSRTKAMSQPSQGGGYTGISTAMRPAQPALLNGLGGLDQFLAQRYVAPAQRAADIQSAWQSGTILPIDTNAITGEKRLGVPEILKTAYGNLMMPFQVLPSAVQSAYAAFRLPGDVLYGRNQNFSPGYVTPGGIADALNFVGNYGMLGSVTPRPANSLGVFGNQDAATFNSEALRALFNDAMTGQKTGAIITPEMAWRNYGLEVRPSMYGGAVYEIPGASKVGLNLSKLPVPPKQNDAYANYVLLKEIMDWPELYAAGQNAPVNPVANVPVMMFPSSTPKTIAGGFNRKGKYIELNPNLSPDALRETLFHETEHVMEDFYGRPGGTSPEEAGSWRGYLSAPGELDARLSEYRSTVPDYLLRQVPLSETRLVDQALMEPKLSLVKEQPYAPGVNWIGTVPW